MADCPSSSDGWRSILNGSFSFCKSLNRGMMSHKVSIVRPCEERKLSSWMLGHNSGTSSHWMPLAAWMPKWAQVRLSCLSEGLGVSIKRRDKELRQDSTCSFLRFGRKTLGRIRPSVSVTAIRQSIKRFSKLTHGIKWEIFTVSKPLKPSSWSEN